jgi:hypothetical protein
MENIYNCKEWKQLIPLERGLVLLVAEGAKPMAEISENKSKLIPILDWLGLDYRTKRDSNILIANQEIFKHYIWELNTNKDELITYIHGRFYGYPDCCVNKFNEGMDNFQKFYENVREAKKSRKAQKFTRHLLPGFIPCSLYCPQAEKLTEEWFKLVQEKDPDSAKAIINWNNKCYHLDIKKDS